MSALPTSLFDGIDPDELEERAGRLLAALIAVIELGRPTEFDALFEATVAKAMIAALAAWIAHPHQDQEQHENTLDRVVAELRAEVEAYRT